MFELGLDYRRYLAISQTLKCKIIILLQYSGKMLVKILVV